jgi:hypothetical protein
MAMIPQFIPNGEVYVADILAAISKQIRAIADFHTDGRPSEKRERYLLLAHQIDLLATACGQPAAIDLLRAVIEPKKQDAAA